MNKKRIISIILIFCLMTGFLAYPTPVYAKNIFQRLFQFLKWSTHHIVTGPGKIAEALTRPLGPVLGPIVANILLANTPNKILKVIKIAEKVQNVTAYEEQTKKLNAAKDILEQRVEEIDEDINNLYDLREQLQKDLISGEMKFSQYKKEIVALNQVIESYESLEEKMYKAAENLKPENLLRQIASDAIKGSTKRLRHYVTKKVGEELKKLVNPEIVNKFMGKDGLNALKVIDLIIAGDAATILREMGYSKDDPDFKALLEEVKGEIKNQLKSDKNYLKGNWRELMQGKIKEIIERMEKERSNINASASNLNIGQNTNTSDTSNVNADDLMDELLEFEENGDENKNTNQALPVDADGCLPGYSFDRLSGTGCVQTNCYDITDAHNDSLGHCICGTTGSVAYDPSAKNQACKYDPKYATCPGCVYKCDYEDGDCVEN